MYDMYAPMARYTPYDTSPSGPTRGLSSCRKKREDTSGLEPWFPLEAGRAGKKKSMRGEIAAVVRVLTCNSLGPAKKSLSMIFVGD